MILVRHGRTQANADGVLAGRGKGVHLDDVGRDQAVAVAERLAKLPLAAVVTSPMERTQETARAIVRRQSDTTLRRDRQLTECDYGEWTGRPIKELAKLKLWKTVQSHPSAVVFPGGESMVAMQSRAVAAARTWDARIAESHGPNACFAVVSHGDVIKSILADASGMHLDQFQRLVVSPASVSVVEYAEQRPFVLHVNDTGSDLTGLVRAKPRGRTKGDATVGGGA
ncbi:MSMEG_4193 family putative phosphomutase [Nocardioidaceae bacterium SCSIO 66511]|nr:MSMEG_4193 family putative phosphomutase [Nocardioidaceae bacterium SCSIO 66511]